MVKNNKFKTFAITSDKEDNINIHNDVFITSTSIKKVLICLHKQGGGK